MASSIVIHMLRPYASEEEYLAHEGFSIGSKTMLLIDQPPLEIDTTVLFEISLTGGQKPIRAEGKVLSYVQQEADQPGGLRIRFKRFGAATKAFIDRAVALRNEASPSLLPGAPGALPSLPPGMSSALPSLPPGVSSLLPSLPPGASSPLPSLPPAATKSGPSASPSPATAELEPLNPPEIAAETSGVHARVALPVAAPKDRDALLARLRGRRAS